MGLSVVDNNSPHYSILASDFSLPIIVPHAVALVDGVIASAEVAEESSLTVDGTAVPLESGDLILPGLVDTHCHLIGPGEMADRIDLVGLDVKSDLLERVAERYRSVQEGSDEIWIEGFGWDETNWEGAPPSRSELDAVAPNRPVALFRIDTHAVACNTVAIERADLVARLSSAQQEFLVRDEWGDPTGLVCEDAVKVLQSSMPRPDLAALRRWYRIGVEECRRNGLVEVHDMNVQPEWIEPLVLNAEAGELTVATHLFLDGTKPIPNELMRPGSIAPNLSVAGIKFFVDGALGSRGAWLKEPYADDATTTGLQTLTAEQIVECSRDPVNRGLAVATHAIGDAAVAETLDAYRVLRAEFPRAVLRIEHAQIVDPVDLPQFEELNILPAVQPIHCISDIAMATERLGVERLDRCYRWGSFRQIGRPLIAGSDFPVESADPFAGMRAFVERRGDSGRWYPDEAISPTDALAAYTSWSGLGLPTERRGRRLQPGFPGPLVVHRRS